MTKYWRCTQCDCVYDYEPLVCENDHNPLFEIEYKEDNPYG